jgi:hypothetical protein
MISFIDYLKEDTSSSNLLIIYPGRFQPAHKNHFKVYSFLKEKFPYADVYVVSSNKIDLPKSPFTFDEKKKMLIAAGIPESNIILTSNPYQAREIVSKYDNINTKLLFAVGAKDMEPSAPRFSFNVTKSGNPAYFKPLPNIKNISQKDINNLMPLHQHGYVAVAPTFNFKLKINGNNINIKSASEIRSMFQHASDLNKRNIITQLYGSFNEDIYNIFVNRLP